MDYIHAAASGASTGLQLAGIDTGANEAADRLRFGYAQLAAEQERAKATLAAQEEQASAADRLREAVQQQAVQHQQAQLLEQQRQHQETSQFHTGELMLRAAGERRQQDSAAALQGYRAKELQKPASPLGRLQSDRAAALARGDSEAVKQFDAGIEESISNHGKSVYMGMDDNNMPIFQMTEGGAKAIGRPTVATQSGAQQRSLQYENATQLISYLQNNLKPEHVGVRGVLGEFVVDRTLEQLVPGVAKGDRISSRATLETLAQNLKRELADDKSGRFSLADRKELETAVASAGAAESYADAMARLTRARQILADRGGVYAQRLGQKAPLWSQTDDQIRKRMGTKDATEEDSLDALLRFHSNKLTPQEIKRLYEINRIGKDEAATLLEKFPADLLKSLTPQSQ